MSGFVQKTHGSSDTGGTSFNLAATAFAAPVTAGNAICGFIVWNGTAITDLTSVDDDSAGHANVFTIKDARAATGGAAGSFTAQFYCLNAAAASNITAHFGAVAVSFARIFPVEENGGVAFDGSKVAQTNTAGTGANGITTGNITTTQNGDVIVAFCANFSSDVLPSVGTSITYTSRDSIVNGSAGDCQIVEDGIQTTAGNIAGTFTATSGHGTDVYVVMIMAFSTTAGADILQSQGCM